MSVADKSTKTFDYSQTITITIATFSYARRSLLLQTVVMPRYKYYINVKTSIKSSKLIINLINTLLKFFFSLDEYIFIKRKIIEMRFRIIKIFKSINQNLLKLNL